MNKRLLILPLLAAAALATGAPRKTFSVVESTIPEMQKAMKEKRVTSREIVQQYLTRIATYDNKLHATITVNPNALKEAEELDRERAMGIVRGPLHGIPIALKDIIHTTNMPTTGGALAFEGFIPPYEATLTKNLRDAGAIIIAKTSLTELANWVTVGMPTNYNAISGYGVNPYDQRRDPAESADGRPAVPPGGSSSGIGTTANFWAANVGTETSGSILNPANATMLVGIKPTLGRISRYGVIPVTADQDTPGPMAKSVTDAAILLGVLESASPDPDDSATVRCPRPPKRDYTAFLKRDSLKGARIGIPRVSYSDSLNPGQSKAMADAIEVLKRQGATVIDPADIPSVIDPDPARNIRRWNICTGIAGSKAQDANCSVVLKYGMKRDFNKWLSTLGPSAPVATLTALREWNLKHKPAGAIKYDQLNLDNSDEMDVERDRARYEADRAKDIELASTHGIDEVMKANQLDALVFPAFSGAPIAARAGYPTIIVPFALIPPVNPAPNAKPVPFGISFTAMACSEPRLIELGYAFEQATTGRVPPSLP
jgi:amidase